MKHTIKKRVLSAGIITLFFCGSQLLYAAWTEPTIDPPDGNPVFNMGGSGAFEEVVGSVIRQSGTPDYDEDFVFGSPTLDDDGNTDHDTRMFFDKSVGAFRVGNVSGNEWNVANRGSMSFATGSSTIASGEYSVSMGVAAKATGYNSFSLGNDSLSNGTVSFATGLRTVASGIGSFATGYETTASGDFSFAGGRGVEASGIGSFATGYETTASGDDSFASGYFTVASNLSAVAMGEETEASGINSFATGFLTKAAGIDATAFGISTAAMGNASVAIGAGATSSGAQSFAAGYLTESRGISSFAIGESTLASGILSFASGYLSSAEDYYAATFGSNTKARGIGSFTTGYETTAEANWTTVFGRGIFNNDDQSFMVGYKGSKDTSHTADPGLFVSSDNTVGIKTSSISSGLALDVAGKIGATEYCDEDGNNCFTAANTGTGEAFYGTVENKSSNTTYQAPYDGIITAYYSSGTNCSNSLDGITDSNSTPTTRVAYTTWTTNLHDMIMFPVKKGDYWKVNVTGTCSIGIKYFPMDGIFFSSVGGGGSGGVGCRLGISSPQTISDDEVFANIAWDVEEYDSGNMHSTTVNSDRVTILEDGRYLITANLMINDEARNPVKALVYKNTTKIGQMFIINDASNFSFFVEESIGDSFSYIGNFVAGDYLRISVGGRNNGTVGPLSIDSNFSVQKID
jgi:hypothetical protein